MNLILFLLGCVVYYTIMGISLANGSYYGLFYAQTGIGSYLMQMIEYFIVTNLVLAVFNLIPVPPLDGYHVLNDLVLKRPLFATAQSARMGQLVLYIAMFSGVLPRFLGWIESGVMQVVYFFAEAAFRAAGLI